MSWQAPPEDWTTWPLDARLGALREAPDPFAAPGTKRAVVGTVDVHAHEASGRAVWVMEGGEDAPAMRLELRTHREDLDTLPGWLERDKAAEWVHVRAFIEPHDGWPQMRLSVELVRTLYERGEPGAFRELAELTAFGEWLTATAVPNDLDAKDPEVVAFMDGCKARARGEILNPGVLDEADLVVATCAHEGAELYEAWRSGLVGTADAGAWVIGKLRRTPVEAGSVELDAREGDDDAE
jgi:hypothetical protein